MKIIKKSYWIWLFLLFSMNAGQICAAELVSFDHLFPISTYQQLLESCMRAWTGIRQGQVMQLSPAEEADWHDCLLGRLVRMKYGIKALTRTNDTSLAHYLLTVLQHIEQEHKDYLVRVPYAFPLFEKSKQHIARLIMQQFIQAR